MSSFFSSSLRTERSLSDFRFRLPVAVSPPPFWVDSEEGNEDDSFKGILVLLCYFGYDFISWLSEVLDLAVEADKLEQTECSS